MTNRMVVMPEATAVVWAMGNLVTATSPKHSPLLRYSTCNSNPYESRRKGGRGMCGSRRQGGGSSGVGGGGGFQVEAGQMGVAGGHLR